MRKASLRFALCCCHELDVLGEIREGVAELGSEQVAVVLPNDCGSGLAGLPL